MGLHPSSGTLGKSAMIPEKKKKKKPVGSFQSFRVKREKGWSEFKAGESLCLLYLNDQSDHA